MRHTVLATFFVLIASLACGGGGGLVDTALVMPPPPSPPVPAPAAPPASSSGPTLRNLPPTAPPGLTIQGSVEQVIGWTDANGDNVVVFSAEESISIAPEYDDMEAFTRRLHVVHGATKDGATRELRAVVDQEERCVFDTTAAFVPEALGVTDLDGDGIGEVTFAYELACRSDVSPTTLKLLLLENGDKYIIRGESIVQVAFDPPEFYGGAKNPDPSVTDGPAAFRTHLDAVWERIVRR